MPKFIVLKVMINSLNITIELPQESKDRRINPTFHTSLVQPYIKNNDILDDYLKPQGAKAPQDLLQHEQAI